MPGIMCIAGATAGRRTGKTKWFDVKKGYGFITPDDGGTEVFAHQSVIQMTGFRSLGEQEEVEFESKPSEKGEGLMEASIICAVGGGDCKGSERHPMSRRTFRRIRCYNCGEFGNHVAAKCPQGPLKKVCYSCKSDDHLIADCPQKKTTSQEEVKGEDVSGNGHDIKEEPKT